MPRTFVWHPSKGPATSPKLEKPGTGKLKKVRHLVQVTPVEE